MDVYASQGSSEKNGEANQTRLHALAYNAARVQVMQLNANGTKTPARNEWKSLQSGKLATPEEVASFFPHDRFGIAVLTGPINGNLEVVDIDDEETFIPFCDEVENRCPGLIGQLTINRTPRPGYHLCFRSECIEPNQTLAYTVPQLLFNDDGSPQLDKNGEQKFAPKALIETRGTKGYIVVEGSHLDTHENGTPYERISGPELHEAPEITAEERQVLFDVARLFSRFTKAKVKEQKKSTSPDAGLRPGDEYLQITSWEEILDTEGWEAVRESGPLTMWRRPGKDIGWSATTGCISKSGNELFCCHTSNGYPFEEKHSYNKFGAYAVINHGGDFSRAGRALFDLGLGDRAKRNAANKAASVAVVETKAIDVAVNAMLICTQNMEDEDPKRLFACVCRAIEYDIDESQAVTVVRDYEKERPFDKYSDEQILKAYRAADKICTRGIALILSNGVEYEVIDAKGNLKTEVAPLTMPEVLAEVMKATHDWPRRISDVLFVNDKEHNICWLLKQAALFGWLKSRRIVRWHGGTKAVTRDELFQELTRTSKNYEAVELYPHEPLIKNHYYAGKTPPPGDGKALKTFLGFFRPETTVDRSLIQAAIMSTFWGGIAGARPAFVIAADLRGVGKSKLAELIAYISGGVIDISPNEDISQIKQRLLSPTALTIRCGLIDNITSAKFAWGQFEALITCKTISGKQMFVGEGQRPNSLTWFMTLNGVSLGTDISFSALREVDIREFLSTVDSSHIPRIAAV